MSDYSKSRYDLIRIIQTICPGLEIKDGLLFQIFATMTDLKKLCQYEREPFELYSSLRNTRKLPQGFIEFFETKEKSQFEFVYEILTEYSEEDFLRLYLPTYVLDVSDAINLANRITTNICDHSIIFFQIKRTLYHFQEITGKNLLNNKSKIYAFYCDLVNKSRTDCIADQDLFWELYAAIGYYSVNSEERHVEEYAAKAVNIWRAMGESDEHIREYAYRFYLYGEQPDQLSELYLDFKNDLKDRYNNFYKAVRSLAKTSAVEFLCALEGREKDDIPLENGIIYSRFLSNINLFQEGKKVLLVHPSTQFIKKWTKNTYPYGIETTIILNREWDRKLIQHTYEDVRFTRVTGKYLTLLTDEEWNTECENGKGQTIYDIALLFATHMNRDQIWSSLRYLRERIGDQISILEAESRLDKDGIYYVTMNTQRMQLQTIELMPSGIVNCVNPSKKIYLTYQNTQDRGQKNKEIEIVAYSLNSTAWREQKIFREILARPVFLSCQMFGELEQSLRAYYNDEIYRRKDHGGKRSKPHKYQFSPELTVWYSVSGKDSLRVSAYLCAPTEDHTKGSSRGARIKESLRYNNKLVEREKIEPWIESEYMFAGPQKRQKGEVGKGVREIVSDWKKTVYRNETISLKTLWYLYPEMEEQFSEREYETVTAIVASGIGWLDMQEVTSELLLQEIETVYPQKTEIMKRHYWLLLQRLIRFGIKNGHYSSKQLRDIVESDHGRNYFSEVREALAKKSFTPNEMLKIHGMICEASSEREDSLYQGILIKLESGLESNVVCGLKWGDFIEIEGFGFFGLRTARQVTNDGKQLKGFENEEDYRIIPCSDDLSKRLLARREKILAEIPGPNSRRSLREMFIVETKDRQPDIVCGVSPRKLTQECRKLIDRMGFKEIKVEIPDDRRGTKESNMAYYKGDIFRENFRAYMAEDMGMTTGEMAYLLGNQATVTYEKYYCDYQNEFSLLQMYLKLQRWANQFETIEDRPERKRFNKESEQIEFSFGKSQKMKSVNIEIFADRDMEQGLELSSTYGIEVDLTVVDEEG